MTLGDQSPVIQGRSRTAVATGGRALARPPAHVPRMPMGGLSCAKKGRFLLLLKFFTQRSTPAPNRPTGGRQTKETKVCGLIRTLDMRVIALVTTPLLSLSGILCDTYRLARYD